MWQSKKKIIQSNILFICVTKHQLQSENRIMGKQMIKFWSPFRIWGTWSQRSGLVESWKAIVTHSVHSGLLFVLLFHTFHSPSVKIIIPICKVREILSVLPTWRVSCGIQNEYNITLVLSHMTTKVKVTTFDCLLENIPLYLTVSSPAKKAFLKCTHYFL